ncbi:MAG: trypsin-like peptidase domain-containing protein [Actinomycetota bacterium]|nr:trypsin-like peptidase domain-containing protein [Actinomycetota bacterium]
MKASRVLVFLPALMLVLASCSSDSAPPTSVVQATSNTIAAVAKTTQPEASEAVGNLEDVRGAIVRIVAEGSFADPEFGQQYNAAGSGSGFFVDSAGIAVTNNHVVTGAAFLQVYVEGEDEPRNARVLGVSECSDLAVIDVEGDGYPFLEWSEGDLAVGTQIYAAGFPLGDEEFTLLDGIISKENADGESDWASIDSVIEHSADTLPGSSGGPIVTEDGKVVAVNYAGDSQGQSYGIGRDEALAILPQLIDGDDVTSIGINGQALSDGVFTGIWVSSVASGSPADLGGIQSGDLVTLVEGLIPATDGSMADYCDILRSHAPGDPLSVEVYRSADDVFLEGTLNTDKSLDVSFSFESALEDEVAAATGITDPGTAGYPSYVSITDVNNTISVDVPTEWVDSDVESLWFYEDEVVGASVSAATNYTDWVDGWQTPGMFFGASATISSYETVDSILDKQDFSFACTYDGRFEYADVYYEGAYDLWADCAGEDTLFVDLVAQPPGSNVLMLLQIVVVSDADLEALDTILNTFVVDEAALANLAGDTTAAPPDAGTGLVLAAWEMLPGDCFDDSSVTYADDGTISTVTTLSCDTAHDNEVVLAYEFPAAPWPGEEAVFESLDAVCSAAWPDYVGVPYVDSALFFTYFYPTEANWAAGIRTGTCFAYDGNLAPLTGSAYMTGQ